VLFTSHNAVNRWIRRASWLLFAATMYLILEEAVWPWFRLPALGNIGFTVVFVLFALIHCTAVEASDGQLSSSPSQLLFRT
jgi:hypothetical protein